MLSEALQEECMQNIPEVSVELLSDSFLKFGALPNW